MARLDAHRSLHAFDVLSARGRRALVRANIETKSHHAIAALRFTNWISVRASVLCLLCSLAVAVCTPPCGLGRSTAGVVHTYAGHGQYVATPVKTLLQKMGTQTICDHGDADTPGVWHAQKGQDYRVAQILGGARKGFFVDLAANQPVTLSNTRTLERDFGWQGLCIDGNSGLVPELAMRRKCSVVQAIVSDTPDTPVTFRRFVHAKWKSTDLHAMSGAAKARTLFHAPSVVPEFDGVLDASRRDRCPGHGEQRQQDVLGQGSWPRLGLAVYQRGRYGRVE